MPGNLALYIFFKRCSELGLDPPTEILKYAGELYDPRRPRPYQPEAGVEGSQEAGSTDAPTASTSHSAVGDTATIVSSDAAASIASAEDEEDDYAMPAPQWRRNTFSTRRK